ncbi:MAG: F0F1 ATP synthase subunit epsilon [Burkholderiales bacterium]|nr:F0F1 ATP synthase subunit epsilon [Burkholderiales bacterium]
MTMRVRVIVPSGTLAEQQAAKLVAEARDGSFCLLPRHVDFVAALVPGIVTLTAADGEETFFAIDEGLLVKHGADVRVSTWNALQGKLGELQQAVLEQFREQDEQEQEARHALDRLEASLVQQVLDWDGRRYG